MIDRIGEEFRVIVAQPNLMDVLLQAGVREHLDGIYIVVPEWIEAMVEATLAKDWNRLALVQQDLSALLKVLTTFSAPLFSTVTTLMNQRGIRGNFAPQPMRPVTAAEREQLFAHPLIQKVLAGKPVASVEA